MKTIQNFIVLILYALTNMFIKVFVECPYYTYIYIKFYINKEPFYKSVHDFLSEEDINSISFSINHYCLKIEEFNNLKIPKPLIVKDVLTDDSKLREFNYDNKKFFSKEEYFSKFIECDIKQAVLFNTVKNIVIFIEKSIIFRNISFEVKYIKNQSFTLSLTDSHYANIKNVVSQSFHIMHLSTFYNKYFDDRL